MLGHDVNLVLYILFFVRVLLFKINKTQNTVVIADIYYKLFYF